MGCGGCRESCPRSLIRPGEDGRAVVDRRGCDACGVCAELCPRAALTVKGGEMTAAEAVREAARDKAVYAASGGGVTLSGGEPLAQAGFLLELLSRLKKEGMRTALETSGQGEWDDIEACLPLLDEIFVDLKHTDSAVHEEWTGVGLERILPQAEEILRRRPDARLRIPVVPGFNTGDDAFAGFVRFASRLSAKTELLPCHRLGEGKYRLLGRDFPGEKIETDTAEAEAGRLAALLRAGGVEARMGGSLGGGRERVFS